MNSLTQIHLDRIGRINLSDEIENTLLLFFMMLMWNFNSSKIGFILSDLIQGMRSITLENLISYLVTRCSHSVVTFAFLLQNVWEVEGPGILSFYDECRLIGWSFSSGGALKLYLLQSKHWLWNYPASQTTLKNLQNLKGQWSKNYPVTLMFPAYFAIDFRPKCGHIVDQGCVFPWWLMAGTKRLELVESIAVNSPEPQHLLLLLVYSQLSSKRTMISVVIWHFEQNRD